MGPPPPPERETPERVELVRRIQADYLRRTGLSGPEPPRRTLWTDAFALCNQLELWRVDGDPEALETARLLVAQVHEVLGRHRPDDPRQGWISGLSEEQGRAHPTRGGLRIGKPRPERRVDEPPDERLEWERDGQYFHYLTQWMHALARLASVAGDRRALEQAVELALVAQRAFTVVPRAGGPPRLCWKRSIDLTRPLVESMGHHDPLDGWLALRELALAAWRRGESGLEAALEAPTAELQALGSGSDWTTADPLGLGGLLSNAYRLAQLARTQPEADGERLAELLVCAGRGLAALPGTGALSGPTSRRLAFRELGLAIGLQAVPRLAGLVRRTPAWARGAVARALEPLLPLESLARAIEALWLEPARRSTESWNAQRDINEVMLATCLLPDGYLQVA